MKSGDKITPFSAQDQSGNTVSSDELLAQGPLVLFFYPKAGTSGCTAESCHFRDLGGEFERLGAARAGISADGVEAQARFDGRHGFGYPLLSDPDRSIAKAFGVKRAGPLPNRRATFVIDGDGTVLEVISSETKMDLHADRALEVLATRGARG